MAKITIRHESDFDGILILGDHDTFVSDTRDRVFTHFLDVTRRNGEVITFKAASRVEGDATVITIMSPDGSLFDKDIIDTHEHTGFDVRKAMEALLIDMLIDFQP